MRLVFGLLPRRRLGCDPESVHVGFVVDEVAPWQVFFLGCWCYRLIVNTQIVHIPFHSNSTDLRKTTGRNLVNFRKINVPPGMKVGRDSSVGIATAYGLDDPGLNPGGGEDFRTHLDRPWGPPSLLYNGYRVFLGGKAAGMWRWPRTRI